MGPFHSFSVVSCPLSVHSPPSLPSSPSSPLTVAGAGAGVQERNAQTAEESGEEAA